MIGIPSRRTTARTLCRGTALAMLVCATTAAGEVVDFIGHNGFEECWPQALTVPQYAALAPSFDGVPGCIPESGAGTSSHVCYSTTCATGVTGCPVTFRGGQSTFIPAVGRFDATNGIEPFSTLATIPLVGECTVSFVDTSTVVFNASVAVPSVADGNNGRYVYAVRLTGVEVTGLNADDVEVSGGFGCQTASIPTGYFADILKLAEPSIRDVFLGASLSDQTICPYP